MISEIIDQITGVYNKISQEAWENDIRMRKLFNRILGLLVIKGFVEINQEIINPETQISITEQGRREITE